MHELALAEAVLAAADDAARKEGLSVVHAVTVRLGELQSISPETFEFCLSQIRPSQGPRVASAAVRLETEPARFQCRPCGRSFLLRETKEFEGDEGEAVHFIPELAHAFLTCPECRSVDFVITGGRGVSIATIEGSP